MVGRSPPVVVIIRTGESTEWTRTVALHDAQELDDDFGRWADENLALAAAFGIDDVVETVVLIGDEQQGEGRKGEGLTRTETRTMVSRSRARR